MKVSTLVCAASALAAALPLAAADLYCSPERPVVFKGETVGLRAWATDPGTVTAFSWSAGAGKLRPARDSAEWDLSGLDPGSYEATVTATSAAETVSCSLQIFYQNQPAYNGRGPAETGRALLKPGTKEPAGYGMYSYLLFGEPANHSNSERYTKALAAYTSLFIPLEQMESYFDRYQLNVFQIPVTIKPNVRRKPTAEQLLAGYDYARARSLLDRIQNGLGAGPYLVSSLAPLASRPAGSPVILQDLSGVPPPVVDLWVREFLNQTTQGHSWKIDNFRAFLLRVRTVIEIVATGYPQVKAGLGETIKLTGSPE